MKRLVKWLIERMGVTINLKKNLWYLDAYVILEKLCSNKAPVIFDIGACDGHTSLIFKNIFPKASLYAFEPFPDSFQLLKNTADNHPDIKAFQLALSNETATKDFYVNKSKATNSLLPAKITDSFIDDHIIYEGKITVPTKTLDAFVAEQNIDTIDILKLDVQGGELLVFEGAKELLSKQKAKLIYSEIWLIEGYESQPLYHDIAAYLAQFGYLPYGIYNLHFRDDGHFLWGDAIFYLKDNSDKN